MAEVTLNSIEKVYPNGFKAIHGIDVAIEDGEFIALVGPSGCGKSTLLRMVAGLESITGGAVSIAGREVNRLEPADRDIAMVFQNYALYPHMTVSGNMAYGLKNRGMAKDEIARRVREAAEILELSELLERRPQQLSGGQRQRVAMGRAIVREPAVFLFDEPLSNLDAKLRVQMRVEVKKLQRQLGTTSLYVTHDQVEAMTMADRLVVMNAGVAEQIGTPIEVYDKPASKFVAAFIGSPSMNFMEARIESGEAVLKDGVRLPLNGSAGNVSEGQTVSLGIRPEHFEPGGDGHGLALKIDLVEHLGADTLVHGHTGGKKALTTVRLSGHRHLNSGETMHLAAAPERLHLFDPESGRRL
ncbi:MAG: sn-glycerol-3-phosphate import ATP-binding protein UgpC [Nisaea sp.]|uniref:sn-glycerol-3-phosphate import ATP-binding protein UgpC n=1 Tax=Nisaea sp. TaxID=2024842 RepID=UPI001B0D8564|nr:sn-glycerol-3-phosphate import ATP-binding protein UgpC [Nisaea sp.]MBO6560569.1 sn-glycerol-3-phosphate import ATP-binding protein UgpC [Nisaea sp.]